jgi:succinate dehydrogenase / fumarate reductase iron-sulfur subunit
MKFTLHIWRQKHGAATGGFEVYHVEDISPDASFLEMMDLLNEQIIARNEDPVTFDSDCREGICGSCSMVIDSRAHGPGHACTTCEVRMRAFTDGAHIYVEPFRSAAFPLIKDLMVDRSALDHIIQAGGYITVHSGPKPEPNSVPIAHDVCEQSMDAAECIGCGACVAACPNGSAMLFTSAKISHLELLPQGKPEHPQRTRNMVHQMEAEGFGACSNHAECQDACPKEISIAFISRLNRFYAKSMLCEPHQRRGTMKNQ